MADRKTVRAVFKETIFTDLGRLAKGRAYEIPEARFTPWEKAGLCEKAKDKDDKKGGDAPAQDDAGGKK